MISKKDTSLKRGKDRRIKQKPVRSYIKTATKAATHPVRSSILKSLKGSAKSTVELEEITGEARYNLYHHLNFLEEVDLVKWKLKDNKTKIYSLKKQKRPQAAVLIFDEHDINEKRKEFQNFINALTKMEGQEIPHTNKIIKVEICLYFPWSEET